MEFALIEHFAHIFHDKSLFWEISSGPQANSFVSCLEHFGRSIFNILKKEARNNKLEKLKKKRPCLIIVKVYFNRNVSINHFFPSFVWSESNDVVSIITPWTFLPFFKKRECISIHDTGARQSELWSYNFMKCAWCNLTEFYHLDKN